MELEFSESVILLFDPTMNNLSVLYYSSIKNQISPDQTLILVYQSMLIWMSISVAKVLTNELQDKSIGI